MSRLVETLLCKRGLGHLHMPIYNLSVFTQTDTTTHTWIQHSAPSVPWYMNSSFCESMKQQLVKREAIILAWPLAVPTMKPMMCRILHSFGSGFWGFRHKGPPAFQTEHSMSSFRKCAFSVMWRHIGPIEHRGTRNNGTRSTESNKVDSSVQL